MYEKLETRTKTKVNEIDKAKIKSLTERAQNLYRCFKQLCDEKSDLIDKMYDLMEDNGYCNIELYESNAEDYFEDKTMADYQPRDILPEFEEETKEFDKIMQSLSNFWLD